MQAQSEVDALLFPDFQHVRGLNLDADPDLPRKFVRSSLLPAPDQLHSIYKDLPESERRAKACDPSAGKSIERSSVEAPTILICSHGQRDSRCGILGPLLHAEFARYMSERRVDEHDVRLVPRTSEFVRRDDASQGTIADEDEAVASQSSQESSTGHERGSSSRSPSSSFSTGSDQPKSADRKHSVNINIGMVSHIGGHKWAGNVILYIPPTFTSQRPPPSPSSASSSSSSSSSSPTESRLSDLYISPHPLAGMGIWYGRVEPRHIEGIVEQTLMQGKVIQELFRGGVSRGGGVLRL